MINRLFRSVMLREFYTFAIHAEREEDTVRLTVFESFYAGMFNEEIQGI